MAFVKRSANEAGSPHPRGKVAMAVTVASPTNPQGAWIDRAIGYECIPGSLADRAGVRRTFRNGTDHILLARSCVTVFSDITFETHHFQILLRIKTRFAQKVD